MESRSLRSRVATSLLIRSATTATSRKLISSVPSCLVVAELARETHSSLRGGPSDPLDESLQDGWHQVGATYQAHQLVFIVDQHAPEIVRHQAVEDIDEG